MKININDRIKSVAVMIGAFRIFGDDKNNLETEEERVKRFDSVWQGGLQVAVEQAIEEEKIIQSSMVAEMLQKQFWKSRQNATAYLKESMSHYQFTYKVLCVAQVEYTKESNEYVIDQLWSFTFPDAIPERFCFQFDKVEDKDRFITFIQSLNQDPREFAKNAVIEKMEEMILQLEIKKQVLELEVQELEVRLRKSNIAYYQKMLTELRERLDQDIPETSGDNSWQTWIYKNSWLFGTQYGQPISKQKIGFQSIPDFLFPTLDGFIDILEIKKPNIRVLQRDKSHPGAYNWSPEITQALGQVIAYLHETELNQFQIAQQINREHPSDNNLRFFVIKPRAFILAGRSIGWSEIEKEAFRKLNYSLNGITVLTYDDLVLKGESLVDLYTREIR